MIRLYAFVFAFALTVVACGPIMYPPTPSPTPVVIDTEFCNAAEVNLNKLGCPEGRPTKRGVLFRDLCVELHKNGIFVNPKCLATISSCTQVDFCTRTAMSSNN